MLPIALTFGRTRVYPPAVPPTLAPVLALLKKALTARATPATTATAEKRGISLRYSVLANDGSEFEVAVQLTTAHTCTCSIVCVLCA